jgi:4-oxalocrotonate tautomerase
MPLARISLVKGKPEAYRRKVGDAIHRALAETLAVPPLDRFQLLTEHEPGDIVIVQATLSAGRTLAQKRVLYRRIAANGDERELVFRQRGRLVRVR